MANTTDTQQINATTVHFQLFFIALTSLTLFFSLLYTLNQYRSYDEPPELYAITPEKAQEFGGSPTIIKVGLQISSFSVFDALTNNFSFSGTVWFEFDPSVISLDVVRKFSFEKSEIKYISEPNTRLINGRIFVRFNVRVDMKANLNHQRFPFNDHTIYITLDNTAVTPAEVKFESNITDLQLSKGVFLPGWQEYDRNVYTGYIKAELEKGSKEKVVFNPRVVFAIDFDYRGIRQVLTIFLPLILIFFIATFSFAMNPQKYYGSIIAISSASVTGLLAYRFVIDNLSPKVGYFMLGDWLFFLFFTATFVTFLINTKTLVLSKKTKELITIALHFYAIFSIVYLINFWK